LGHQEKTAKTVRTTKRSESKSVDRRLKTEVLGSTLMARYENADKVTT